MRAILESGMCSSVAAFKSHNNDGGERKCDEARRALRFTPLACAIRQFWRHSEPYRIYHMLAQSPLTLFATLMLLLFAAYKWQQQQQQQQEPTPLQRQIYARYHEQ